MNLAFNESTVICRFKCSDATEICDRIILNFHMKLAPEWTFIQVKFDSIQENEPKVSDGCSFVRLQY